MAKKVKKSGKWADDDWENEIPEAEGDSTVATTEESTPAPESSQEATEATEEDFMSAIKKSKTKKKAKEDEEKAKPKAGPVIKSKKEKEKEKKEAEKQRKKEIAEKKKAAADARRAEEEAARAKKLAAAGPQDTSAPVEETKPVEEASKEEEVKEEKKAPASKKKKGVPNSAIAALKRQMELRKQAEEQERLEEEEEKRREEEEEKARIEEEQAKEEAKKAKKEKEKAKKEALKAEGKFMTKKQKEEKKLQEKRRQALLASGNIVVPALQGKDTPAKPAKVVYGNKKKKSKNATPTPDATATKEVAPEEEEELVEDWEKMALEDDAPVAEDWEAALDEESDGQADVQDDEEFEAIEDGDASEAISKEAEVAAAAAAAAATAAAAEAEAAAKAAEEAKAVISKKGKPAAQDENNLRSPICCILGHVDTGKTKLLDKIRQTNVQGGEAGGITQQIGATYFPVEAIKQKTKVMAAYEKQTFDVPGLLIIDTPGHESFTNLRSRGSSLCNIAVLVIDIMHGLEQQTLESIRLLRERKAPFIVALNKIDRLYDWKAIENNSFRDSFSKQGRAVQSEFQDRLDKVKLALAEQGLNSELYFQNRNMAKYVSIVPTSAVTGEGVPDLIWLLLELTQKRMSKQLMYLSKIEATVLEVKVVEGLGTTIDVVLSNGVLREGDRIVICGLNGPIATNVRALLTPQPLRELRIKSEYVHHKEVKAALGVKIAANDLEKAVAGSRLLVVGEDDDEDEMMDEVMDDLTGLLDSVDSSGRGVTVQASTLGSLEALLDFLKDMKIPVMSIGLGPVYKRDVMKASAMLDKAKEYAVMLCFDVKIDKEAEHYAEEQGVKLFSADVIYHLFDAFTAYQQKLLEQRRQDFLEYAIFPCVLKTIQIINKRNPMIIGVDVAEGTVRTGTPICAVKVNPTTKEKEILLLGRVSSLEVNHKSEAQVKKGQTAQGVAMRLENPSAAQPVWGRHLDENDTLYSLISRRSIDTLKDPAFRDTVPREDWVLLKNLKSVFDIK